jgi:hypothetical protein
MLLCLNINKSVHKLQDSTAFIVSYGYLKIQAIFEFPHMAAINLLPHEHIVKNGRFQ